MEKGEGSGKQGGGKKGKLVYRIKDDRRMDTSTTDPSDALFGEVDSTPFWTEIASSREIIAARVPGEHFPKVQLLTNHFPIRLNDPSASITRCTVEVQVVKFHMRDGLEKVESPEKLELKNKSQMRFIVEQLYSQHPMDFPPDKSAYNGSGYIFSAKVHDTREFRINIPDKGYYYIIKVVEVDQVQLSKLRLYFSDSETISGKDRDILFQGLDSIMKERPTRSMIRIRRNFYNKEYHSSLKEGAAVHTGFKQSLKLTSHGPALCLDYSAVLFYKTNFFHFLQEAISGFRGPEDLRRCRRSVERALTGLKVQTTHTNIKYTFVSLTDRNTRDLVFDIVKPDGTTEPTKVVDYFQTKYGRYITYKAIPCLILRRKGRESYMPIELCELAEGQMYPNQQLKGVKQTSVPRPQMRKKVISDTVIDRHGPFSNGVFSKNFGIQLTPHMTAVDGGLINPPLLKLTKAGGTPSSVTVNQDICDWNYSGGKNFAEGKMVKSWGLVNLGNVNTVDFIEDLKSRSRELGMVMGQHVLYNGYDENDISSIGKMKKVVGNLLRECKLRPLQIIIFITKSKFKNYGYLKWFLETQMGVISQCCLSTAYNNGRKKKDVFLDNLCMKINGKIGGSNVALDKPLPHFSAADCVMFIGADVNHPAAKDTDSLSIAAVVGTVNWPAANRYVARIETQKCRNETINKFGAMCKDLVNTFSESNGGKKPDKIVVFRDGVGEGQFDMVLKEEIDDLRRTTFTDHYKPKITVVLAWKRHRTRIFPRDKDGNVLPGTVVDKVIVDTSKSDFFLCSHFGAMGTSKPVHYHVLLDENKFPLHELQKLIYHLCFTYAKCTKPVSLVPPVYYADRAAERGRLYYEAADRETSVAAGSESSSSSVNPSVGDCCNLHEFVKNTMFFI